MEYNLRISKLPKDARPRERLFKVGADSLSEIELLAILLRIGREGKSAIELATELLVECGGLRGLDSKTPKELCQISGIGMAKAAQIKAALELGKRLQIEPNSERKEIRSSQDAFDHLYLSLCNQPREQFVVLLLTSRNKLIKEQKLFEGSLLGTEVSGREVVKLALNEQAAGIIFAHNHPSGNPSPSPDDLKMTKKLRMVCEAVDVQVIDHIIIGGDSFMSFADEGVL